jgi:hypothetical protein
VVCAVLAACGLSSASLKGQTIRGTLLERGSDSPIHLGFVGMYTESGDSVTSTITNETGRFEVTSPLPGNFLLLAAALGHRETTVGVFELGEGGELTVEFRIPVEALTLEGLLVQADRVAQVDQQPALVMNGFSRRMQHGLGRFLTPADIESSPATRISDLFVGMLGVVLLDDRLQMRTTQGYCAARIYVDGLPAPFMELDNVVTLEVVEAIEVYQRATEVPLQYGGTGAFCGVILFWTKIGS